MSDDKFDRMAQKIANERLCCAETACRVDALATAIAQAIRMAVEEERDGCAKVAEHKAIEAHKWSHYHFMRASDANDTEGKQASQLRRAGEVAAELATAIRSRSQS